MQQKTILITGTTDGIGLETAKRMIVLGHQVLIHWRNPEKLKTTQRTLSGLAGGTETESYLADLSNMSEVDALAHAVTQKHAQLDVLINNAGYFKLPGQSRCPDRMYALSSIPSPLIY